jgi:bifunctional oligoribonuclease and PAP phosphatase NrnA
MIESYNYKKAYEKIKGAKRILLATHIRPDGDAIASVSAMAEVLALEKKDYTIFCRNLPELKYRFLPHADEFISEIGKARFFDFDLIIIFDCGNLERSGLAEELNDKKASQFVIEFDHHKRTDNINDLELRDVKSSSTAEMVSRFIKANCLYINKNIATSVLTGILTDTGMFINSLTSKECVEIASEMVSLGAPFAKIYRHAWQNKSFAGMKIWGRALKNLTINKRINLAYTVLNHEDLFCDRASNDDLEALVNFLACVEGVRAVLILREEKGGIIRGNLRSSHPTLDISKLAGILGGGGHPKASAFVMNGRMEKIDGRWKVL